MHIAIQKVRFWKSTTSVLLSVVSEVYCIALILWGGFSGTYWIFKDTHGERRVVCTQLPCYAPDSLQLQLRNLKSPMFFFFSLNVDKNNRSNSIPTWILELLNIEISDQPAILFSQSLSPGIFPSILKISKIIPIYKKWSKLECSNYWSMSLLSNTEKILARLIHNRLCSKRDLKKRTDISTPM